MPTWRRGSSGAIATSRVRPEGQEELGTKIEIKNMNSISAVRRALAYEIERQTKALRARREHSCRRPGAGMTTRAQTYHMRTKESAHDYRYFPDPDLLPVNTSVFMDEVRARRPELPQRKARAIRARVRRDAVRCECAGERARAGRVISTRRRKGAKKPKNVANWMINDLLSALAAAGKTIDGLPGFRPTRSMSW